MPDEPDIASVARLMGDPTRATMLTALMDGQALTATELALESGVTPSTASSHLSRLAAAGLTATVEQGRHRYFRIASSEVAAAIEGLMNIAPSGSSRSVRAGPRADVLRHARVCYDHLAGEVAVRLLVRMREKKLISGGDETMLLTPSGEAWCDSIGVDLVALRAKRRRLCRPCLDWSERRTHLAGSLGGALLDRLIALRYVRRERSGRAVILSPKGEAFVERLG